MGNPSSTGSFTTTNAEKFGANLQMKAMGLIWQGHMLDLMGKRPEALSRYRTAAGMDLSDAQSHGQYGLNYKLSPYAGERLKTPFKRIENGSLD